MTDTFTIAHGAGGLWERHQWNGGFILNAQDQVDGDGAPVRDVVTVDSIGGLHSLPDRQDLSTPRVGRIGDNPRRATPRGRTLTYKGEIRSPLIPSGLELRTSMIAAFATADGLGYMDILRHADAPGPTGRFYAHALTLDVPEELDEHYFRRDYTLGLRMHDPRIYFPSLAVDVSGNPAAINNVGSAPVDPIITVAGASSGDDIAISDGTHTLSFTNVPAGSLVIDFAARTAKVGDTHCELVVADSDWWDRFNYGIEPGSHSISQTGGTGVRVQFTPAVWA